MNIREENVERVKARECNYPLATENKLKGKRGAKVEVRANEVGEERKEDGKEDVEDGEEEKE